jgi:hypothetical protein
MPASPDDRLAEGPDRGVGPAPRRRAVPAAPEADEDHPTPPPSPSLRLPRAAVRPDSVRCPFCFELAEGGVGVRCLLGPPLLECRRCRAVFLSNRREWADLGAAGRAWFAGASALYVVAVAALAFGLTVSAFFIVRASVPWWVTAVHTGFWAAATVGVQGFRLVRSLRRTRGVERRPVRPSFWGLDFAWKARFMLGMVLTTVVLAWLATVRPR